jgi:hypothetical protein
MDKIISKTNILLVKDDIGKPKPNTYQLPNPPMGYGKGDKVKQAGAGVICQSWQIHEKSIQSKLTIPINFRKVNKMEAWSKEKNLMFNVSLASILSKITLYKCRICEK